LDEYEPVVAGVRVVAPSQLERIDLQLRGELVEQAFEAEGALDEARRANAFIGGVFSFGSVLDRVDVVALVQHLHRPRGRREPAVPAERGDELALERGQRPVGARTRAQALDRRVAVARVEILLASRQRALDWPAGALRELGGDERVVPGAVLRPEAAAHVLADHAHLVGGQTESPRDLVADPPHVLGRDVDDELVAFPVADRLVRLERVVEDGLGAVGRLDDGVGLGEAALDVAAGVRARVAVELLRPDRLLGVEHRLQQLVLDARRASAARAWPNVSAATAAIGWPW
jgi:hypothetical protein